MTLFNYRKVGGLHHWRIGRLGGSFYIARRRSNWTAGPIAIIVAILVGA